MLRNGFSALMAIVLLISGTVASAQSTQPSAERASQIATWKEQISKRGVGEKSKWTVQLEDGRKLKGYTGEIGEDGFTLVDLKTEESHPINYNEINRLNPRVGMPIAAQLAITAGVLAGIVLVVTAITVTD